MSEPTENLPALGRLLGLIERHFLKLLLVGSLGVLAAGLVIPMHGEFEVEEFGGFFAIYGFVSMIVLLILTRLLRPIVTRPEDYYGDQSVNDEPYPADQLEVRDHDL